MSANEWFGQARSGKTGALIQTVGGPLVLKPGQDITLQAGQAPGLIGNFVLQFQLTCFNPGAAGTIDWALYVITVNSGFFETLGGSSRIVKGVLSEADIISADIAPESGSMSRLVGHGWMDKIGSFLTKAKDVYTATKPMISGIKEMLPEEGLLGKVKSAASAVGYGARAGAGGLSGAAKPKSLSMRLM